jgi:hypothetical protein
MNKILAASMAILVLVLGIGSNVLFHSAEAKTTSKHRFPIYGHSTTYGSVKFSPAGNTVTSGYMKFSLVGSISTHGSEKFSIDEGHKKHHK